MREFLDVSAAHVDAVDALSEGHLRRYEAGWVRYEAGWVRYDDAVPALPRARATGLVIAVFTDGDADQQHVKLRRVGLAAEVDVVVASSDPSAGKPAPRARAEALSRVGAPAHGAVMVGDSLANDVRGALAAGVRAVLLDRRGEHPDVDVPRISSLDEPDLA